MRTTRHAHCGFSSALGLLEVEEERRSSKRRRRGCWHWKWKWRGMSADSAYLKAAVGEVTRTAHTHTMHSPPHSESADEVPC